MLLTVPFDLAQGWGWGREAGGVSNNQVVGNKIESVLSERCCDGGAVCKQQDAMWPPVGGLEQLTHNCVGCRYTWTTTEQQHPCKSLGPAFSH